MATIEVNYFNTFMLNKLVDNNGDPSFPAWLGGSPVASGNNWYVEESRIRGGYNNVENGYGVKAYIVEDQKASQNLTSNIIYSGVYNSITVHFKTFWVSTYTEFSSIRHYLTYNCFRRSY